MKTSTTGTNKSAGHSFAGIGHQYTYRRNLSLRGEEQNFRETGQPSLTAATMAEQLQLLEQYIARVPEIDFHRRNMIRNAIVTGAYVIDPVSIAEKFLKFEADLYR